MLKPWITKASMKMGSFIPKNKKNEKDPPLSLMHNDYKQIEMKLLMTSMVRISTTFRTLKKINTNLLKFGKESDHWLM